MKIFQQAKDRYFQFISNCRQEAGFSLTIGSDVSSYALCFAIFGYHLIGKRQVIDANLEVWDKLIRANLRAERLKISNRESLRSSKAYLQLLTFSLSALSILGTLRKDPLEELVVEVIPNQVNQALNEMKVHLGVARSGNQAMFLAILLLHARDYLGLKVDLQIKDWVDFQLTHMNSLGFWGPRNAITHLQFQNGYHQYEILEYLAVSEVDWVRAAREVSALADSEGHFAPYPGGGGCYDYDAIFILTGHPATLPFSRPILHRTYETILSEQNPDGGFCESQKLRPFTYNKIVGMLCHTLKGHGPVRYERFRYFLSLMRPKNRTIYTHWSQYSRKWNESDLWDSWFRMLTLARIDSFLNRANSADWGFIPYPGIGYHPSVREVRAG